MGGQAFRTGDAVEAEDNVGNPVSLVKSEDGVELLETVHKVQAGLGIDNASVRFQILGLKDLSEGTCKIVDDVLFW